MPAGRFIRTKPNGHPQSRILGYLAAIAALVCVLAAHDAPAQSQEPPKHEPAIVPPTPRPAETPVVEMTDDLEFSPQRLRVRAGQEVEWRNTSRIAHTVTADPELAADPDHVQLPEGAAPFDSGRLEPGARFRQRFDVPGHYRYVCTFHEAQGMVGWIEVTPR